MAVEMEIVCHDEPRAEHLVNIRAQVHAMGMRKSTYGRSPAMLAWLRENVTRFDGVVVNGIWTYSSLAVCKTAHGRTPYAIFTHGMLDPWFRKRYPLKHLKKYLYWPVQHRVLHQADAVLFTTQLECDLAKKSFWPHSWNSVVVPYGTSPPPGTQADLEAQRQAFEQALPQLHGRRFLLFLSRIHEKKGCDLLIKAFARIAPAYPDVDLVVAGPDQVGLQARLQQQAEHLGITARVHWPGMLRGATKWGTMRSAETFILPSHQENFGIVVAEALACGKPVLIS
jgi:glycosyltransferase involved in cell wall biosynthesis